MVVEYENETIRKLFEDLKSIGKSKNLLLKKIGADLTKIIKKRVNQILAFPSFYDLQTSGIGKFESLSGDLNGYYKLNLTGNYRLIFRPDIEDDLNVEDRKKCDTLIVKGVCDYHGQKTNWLIL